MPFCYIIVFVSIIKPFIQGWQMYECTNKDISILVFNETKDISYRMEDIMNCEYDDSIYLKISDYMPLDLL